MLNVFEGWILPNHWELKRKCVLHRESDGSHKAHENINNQWYAKTTPLKNLIHHHSIFTQLPCFLILFITSFNHSTQNSSLPSQAFHLYPNIGITSQLIRPFYWLTTYHLSLHISIYPLHLVYSVWVMTSLKKEQGIIQKRVSYSISSYVYPLGLINLLCLGHGKINVNTRSYSKRDVLLCVPSTTYFTLFVLWYFF